MTEENQAGTGLAGTLGWAVFLGCSWTWCIGMFLPVLLVRDLGLWGWIVFAVPNVIGAAAMGWVLKPGSSEFLVRQHAGACSAFSAVTIAFHIFFVLWFLPRLIGLPITATAFAIVAIYLIATASRGRADLPSAAVAWLVSIAMLALFLHTSGNIDIPTSRARGAMSAVWLSPVCALGFFLCPYLDLTLHRALRASHARVAFPLGFGLFFLAMIVFTLIYSKWLAPMTAPGWHGRVAGTLATIVAVHMLVQSAFTLAIHTRAIASHEARLTPGRLLALIVLAQLALLLGLASHRLPPYHGLDAGELVYRLFMAFYGLLFPAYVWVCIVPGRDGTRDLTAAKLRAMLLGVLVAAPMYWMGFIEQQLVWLVPGVAAVLMSRFTIPRRVLVLQAQ